MTQHINLLRKQRLVPLSLIWGGLGVLVILAAHAGYGLWLLQENARTQARLQAQATELQALRNQVALTGQPSQGAAQLQADIARLTPMARSYAGLLEQVKGGRLGLEGGYLDQLTILARTIEPNVWITQVSIGEAGRRLSVEGKALNEQSVLTYAERLNQAYRAQGLTLAALEMTVDAASAATTAAPSAQPPASGKTALVPPGSRTISFRLN